MLAAEEMTVSARGQVCCDKDGQTFAPLLTTRFLLSDGAMVLMIDDTCLQVSPTILFTVEGDPHQERHHW
eukprot:4165367-Amphidinium_carterae.1